MVPLAFAPDGTLFAADTQGAAIVALDLGAQANGGAAGAKGLDAIDEKLAALLGTGASEVVITDLAVHPKTRNAYVSVMRGQGAGAAAALFRVDGSWRDRQRAAPDAAIPARRDPERARRESHARGPIPARRSSPTWRLRMAASGWPVCPTKSSRPSCARSRIRSPASMPGTSVEIYHGNHKAVETRSPVNAFVPYTLNGEQYLLAGYTCTPLVKFPISNLKPGQKVRGVTIAEFGAGNRVLDMIVYRKGGQEFLLTTNNSRGVMKIPTNTFAAAAPITAPVETETGGVPFEKVTTMTGIQQLDKLDDNNSIVVARTAAGGINLQVLALP